MMQGTTPTHHFNIPFDASQVVHARAIYKQRGKEILKKETEDFHMEGNRISVQLTQEETFLFIWQTPVKIQLRIRTKSGQVLNTKPIEVSVGECLEEEVL